MKFLVHRSEAVCFTNQYGMVKLPLEQLTKADKIELMTQCHRWLNHLQQQIEFNDILVSKGMTTLKPIYEQQIKRINEEMLVLTASLKNKR